MRTDRPSAVSDCVFKLGPDVDTEYVNYVGRGVGLVDAGSNCSEGRSLAVEGPALAGGANCETCRKPAQITVLVSSPLCAKSPNSTYALCITLENLDTIITESKSQRGECWWIKWGDG